MKANLKKGVIMGLEYFRIKKANIRDILKMGKKRVMAKLCIGMVPNFMEISKMISPLPKMFLNNSKRL